MLPLAGSTKQSGKAVANTESSPSASTKVSLSEASQASLAVGVSTDEQVFDSNKVEQIKAAMANGQFQVNSSKIADGLLDSVRSLLGANGG